MVGPTRWSASLVIAGLFERRPSRAPALSRELGIAVHGHTRVY